MGAAEVNFESIQTSIISLCKRFVASVILLSMQVSVIIVN